jgi:hypothetical protein
MNIKESDSIILLAASNLVTMRVPGQGVSQKAVVKATIEIFKRLKEELSKEQD